MGRKGHGDRGRAQGQKREFFQDQGLEGPGLYGVWAGCGAGQTPKRPEIEQKQDQGHGRQHGLGHEPQGQAGGQGGVGPGRGFLGVAKVGVKAEHEKKPGEHVLALGDPGHGFHVQGMDGEERGGQGRRPNPAGHAEKDQEEQGRVQGVEQEVDQVVAEGAWAEQKPVGKQGQGGQGVEVGELGGSEGLGQGLGKGRGVDRVLGDGLVVVGC
ncbi:MAG: hypothetical protein L7F78_23480, partial [Syntrophales bacterium LBB04]|nr:hypothetical protein [Syntrophales bacterium LBB04]